MLNCSFCLEQVKWAEILEDDRVLCAACRWCIFFEEHLTLTGDFGGEKFRLINWQRRIIRDVFGTLDEEGLRVFRDVYLEVPTGNSKTTFCAGLVVCALASSTTSGTEIYSAATAKDQAAITFRMAHQMVLHSPELQKELSVIPSTKRIVRRDDPTSFYAAISADGDVHDGINPSLVIRDELHRWRTRKALELNEVLERKVLKRKNPLIVDITTAGESDESPLCWRRHEYARQIEEGVFTDRRFYGRIFAADAKRIETERDFWKSREARVQANPSHEDHGGYIKDSALEDLCIKAQNDPQVRHEYLRYNLNYWGNKDNAVIDMPKWIACGGKEDLRDWPEYDIDLLISKWGLADRPCYAGVDASWTTDLTSLVLVFPAKGEFQTTLLPFFWMPREQVVERERKDKVPYGEWVRKNFIETTAGHNVSQSAVRAKIAWARQMFDLREVAYDPWNFGESADQLTEDGIVCVKISQTYSLLSEPTKKLLGWYLDGQLRHGNHPVLNWNAKCLHLQADHKDNVQPDKPDRSRTYKRIDGISATVTSLARMLRVVNMRKPLSLQGSRA